SSPLYPLLTRPAPTPAASPSAMWRLQGTDRSAVCGNPWLPRRLRQTDKPGIHWRPALFNLDACELDHPRPLFDGVRDDLAEFRGRAPEHRAAELDDPGLDPAVGEPGIELLVQQIDDFGWGVPGRADAAKTAGLIAGHEVCHRWNVRQHLQTGRGRY